MLHNVEAWRGVVTVLGAATATPWEWEGTGGGCFALTTRAADHVVVITWAIDTFTRGSVPADENELEGYFVGVYAPDHEGMWEGEYVVGDHAAGEALPMVVRDLVGRVTP